MTLKNIPLPEIILSNLYKYSLVEEVNNIKELSQKKPGINFLGGNEKNILLLVNSDKDEYLPETQLTFLAEILAACKLSMKDIAVINLDKGQTQEFKDIPVLLQSEIIIASDIEPSTLELPFKIPEFQVQEYKEKKYVFIPSFDNIKSDGALKRKLWELLKSLFSI